ncbi:MAG TPA: DUF924 family protein [Alphaproteobacteria bacterium]|nr:DUF924 family protein [Alphaproteobacteria bacterium]
MTELREHWSRDVLRFWFHELEPDAWFRADPELDETIRRRFFELHRQLKEAPAEQLLATPQHALAAIIVFDQFSRNMFRGRPEAYATDSRALRLAETSVDVGFDRHLSEPERQFLYLPFMHAEDREAQRRSVALCATLVDPKPHQYALGHKAIIEQFGRFPHRNAVLGRASTAEEVEFLKSAAPF